jgi:hypothetical protein
VGESSNAEEEEDTKVDDEGAVDMRSISLGDFGRGSGGGFLAVTSATHQYNIPWLGDMKYLDQRNPTVEQSYYSTMTD